MKQLLNNLFNRSTYLLLAALGLFAVAYLLNKYVINTSAIRYYAYQVERWVQKKEKDFREVVADTALLQSLVSQTYTEATLDNLLDKKKDYCLFIYSNSNYAEPELVFWNTQVTMPPQHQKGGATSYALQWENGIYVYDERTLTLDGRSYTVKAMIPVMWKYFVEVENLKKEFVPFANAGKWVDISFTGGLPVRNSSGKVLFYLQQTSAHDSQKSGWVIGLVIVAFFLLFMYLQHVADFICRKYGFWFGLLFLAGTILLLRFSIYQFPGVLDLRQFELFDPAIYSSSLVLSSLGDLFINSVLLCWIVLFVNRRMDVKLTEPYVAGWKNWVLLVIVLSIQVMVSFVVADILQSLVADAQISFNVMNVFSLTFYSFIGFVVLAILALSYFLLSQILITWAGRLVKGRNYLTFIITAVIGLSILSVAYKGGMAELNLCVLMWLLAFIWLMQLKIFSGLGLRLNVSEVLFWLFVFSLSMSVVIIFENNNIELDQRKRFAEKLYSQADPANEHLVSIALTYLDSNFLADNFDRFRDPVSNSFLKDSIISKNYISYVNQYDTRIFTFDSSHNALYNDDRVSYDTLNTIFRIQGKKTKVDISELRYFEKSFDKFAYIYRQAVKDSSGYTMGYVFILAEPKKYKSDALVPELFKQTRELVPEYSSVYSYAVYDASLRLIQRYNDYPFPTHLQQSQLKPKEFWTDKRYGYDELWYRQASSKVVIIARKSNTFIESITLFAYLFSTFLFLLAFYRFSSILLRSRLRWNLFKQNLQFNIRSQIHTTIILVSLLSFLVIGIATIFFFISRYHRNNRDRLARAIQIMEREVQTKLLDNDAFNNGIMLYEPGFGEEVENVMKEVAEIHGTDVNLYDTSGNLRFTSNPDVYERGVSSKKMNPQAYFQLHNRQLVQSVIEENVAKVNYLSIYNPVLDNDGIAIAYINTPSYSAQGDLKQEISNLLVTIINLNAFIFLVAGAIALFITNRITSSFTIIAEKMREVNLRKVNQEIEWKRNDELGILVQEYNKMVHTLDESVEALARGEREGAWRQMARQVAHEIKNPLTPMKLSIQYLQKAIDNNSPDVKNMTANVARTLVEQIDHLSKIASDFSQFANIGNPRNEVFDLHELLYSLSSLYEATENLDFKWEPVHSKVLLFADKTQLNRLFTNLLQNAIEASASCEQRIIRVHEELSADYVTVSVTDNGTGIPEATQSKIFTPNFTTKSSGTGLGLAMSKSIVEQANGEIWFKTEEGAGTTFFVKLPLLRATS
ncbi:MAG: ATP-binding protein [Chitinophagaceae bacterium]